MSEAQEVKARAKELREQKAELKLKLESSFGEDIRALRLELARVEEELIDCSRRLKELIPSHKVSHRTTWAGVDGWQWDRMQYKTWAELESAEVPDGLTSYDMMRISTRTARQRSVTEKQDKYMSEVEHGKKAAQVARDIGRDSSTVARTIRRGKARITKDAKALYQVLQAQQGSKNLIIDLSNSKVLEAVLSLLTPRQQLYLYLYYGEWLSLREIGKLLRVDHASVLRSIRCGLERLNALALGDQIEVRGLETLEEQLMVYFNAVEFEDIEIPPRSKSPPCQTNPRRSVPFRPLQSLVLLFHRGGETRRVEIGETLLRSKGPKWGSGKLLATLEAYVSRFSTYGREKEKRRQMLGRLLQKLFSFIRRSLHADNH